MSENRLPLTTKVDPEDLIAIIEKAYRLNFDEFELEFDKEGIATVVIETGADKHAGLALDITDAGMTAKLSLFPAINNGVAIDYETVEEFLLDERKIDREMIDWGVFSDCFSDYELGKIVYQIPIAYGIPKVDGTDAKVSLFFDIEEKKPKLLADGSVDFKDINNIVMVEEGDLLLHYEKETDGSDGKKVRGELIPAKKGKKIKIIKGGGVEFDEESGYYSAEVSGHVTYKRNKLSVNPVYAVNGDVDYSEGNVDFHGTVKVSGDVLSGFEIRAKNIMVQGIVRDAILTAKEDITVRTGIVSTGKGEIRAGHNVTSNFFEGATVYAGSAVIIKNYCYNTKIFCEGDVLALSGDGVINGGEIHAFGAIEAKKIGFENSSSFPVHVGVKYNLTENIDILIKQKDDIRKKLEDADKTIRLLAKQNPDIKQKEQLKSIIGNRKILFDKYEGIDNEIENLIKESMHSMPYILVKNEINEGIKVVIYNTEQIVPKKVTTGGKFIFNQATGHVIMVDQKTATKFDLKEEQPDHPEEEETDAEA